MRNIELLAPAKNKETAIAAIDHGADAVYIGAHSFGARAAAGNTTDDIRQVVEYARPFRVRVYATLNTLLHTHELPQAVELAHELFEAGVDAVISQDHRMVRLYRQTYPHETPHFHASTQMDNRSADIVRERLQQGYQQTVLARELTIDEIRSIHQAVPAMPLEVFVHGAICVSYNGRCYASEVCYNRSANRGECAQFCRMPYRLLTRDDQVLAQGYLLSMRDMNRTDYLEDLLDAGVTSFKIEGRLKDIAYVKNVTAWYRQKLDAIMRRRNTEYRRSSQGIHQYSFTPDIHRTFNRGYTDYFMHRRTTDLCTLTTPKSIGQSVGMVKEIRRDHIIVSGTIPFSSGDGLVTETGIGFRVNRAEGNHLYLRVVPAELRPRTPLYRNQDQAMEKALAGHTATRRLPLTWTLSPTHTGFSLTAQVGDAPPVTKNFEYPHQTAQTPQSSTITDVLGKLGQTIYCVGQVHCPEQYFIPRSTLAEWRRAVIDQLDLYLEQTAPAHPTPYLTPQVPESEIPEPQVPKTLMECRYCIRYQIGQCLRSNPKAIRGPLWLEGKDGRRYPLQFDCQRCQMMVMSYLDVKRYS